MKAKRLILVVFAAILVLAPATPFAAPADGATADAAATAPATKAAVAPATAPSVATTPKADVSKATVKAEPVPEKQDWWQVLLAELLKLFALIAVPVLSTVVVSLLKRWKINVEFEQVNKIATAAAGWAEQKALSALKEDKKKTSGGDKMKMALDFANGMAKQYKLPSKATTKLQELIESSLGQEKVKAKANGNGASSSEDESSEDENA